jgi:uncharacterized protein YegP (UPF0339 family)
MAATFKIKKDRAGEYRWNLVHTNGNIIADSGEGYTTLASCKNGIQSVKDNAPSAEIQEED